MFELRGTGDYDLFLGPLEWVMVKSVGDDKGVSS